MKQTLIAVPNIPKDERVDIAMISGILRDDRAKL